MSTTTIFDPKITCNESEGGGGADTFIELLDTPESYEGEAGKVVTVNPSGTGLIFETSSGGGGGEGNSNVFEINTGEVYTVQASQELISTGVFYLDGQMNLNGKWALLGEGVVDTGSFGDIGDDHTHSDLIQLAELNMVPDGQGGYTQTIYHTLQGFPLLKFLTPGLREVDPVVRHVSVGEFIIESNTPLTGRIYALHSTQTRVPVLFGPLNLQAVGGQYEQIIEHSTNSFPFFKIMDGFGSELGLEVQHLSRYSTKIISNVLVTGQIYML